MPKDDRDLVVSAGNSWLLAYDNLSSVPGWFSDALCRLATGGGFATRMLHTDKDEMIFEGSRPIILNGIPMLTDRADLADRALTIHLQSVPEDQRKPEDEFFAEFEAARPRILGGLLDAVSAAQRNVATVRLDRSPRMADFVKWVTAAEPGLGWEPGAFLAAYQENRRDVSESVFEADVVAVAIFNFGKEKPDGWEGTATELLTEINNRTPEGIRRSRSGRKIRHSSAAELNARSRCSKRKDFSSSAGTPALAPLRSCRQRWIDDGANPNGLHRCHGAAARAAGRARFLSHSPWATRALFKHVLPALGIDVIGSAWEPACGEGHMAAVIAEFASAPVIASDIYDYSYGTVPVDFLHDAPLARPEWIITNPPFALACEFTLRALDLATVGVAMLARTQWIEGVAAMKSCFVIVRRRSMRRS
jgi:hypothetical protein